MMNGKALSRILGAALALLFLPAVLQAAGIISDNSFGDDNEIMVEFSTPVDGEAVQNTDNYTVFEENDPDIRLKLEEVVLAPDNMSASLRFAAPLNTTQTHVVKIEGISGKAEEIFIVSKSYLVYLFSVLIGSLLIKNFVFTKYLGLCVFFGTSKKKTTAKGMGVVFTLVMVATGIMSWFFYQYVLKPYNLTFLQIVVFIGLTSLTVQAIDTILRKVNPVLFNSFGVFLVLVIANCVVIAVPLIMASNEYNFFETFMLSLGAGGGFLLALYLMSSVSERMRLAKIPPTFQGLPIAFIVAGQFAMAFLGFSGLKLF
jgi:electron transport complex protein RnfA